MFRNIEITKKDAESTSTKQHLSIQYSINNSPLNMNTNRSTIRSCARGKFLRANSSLFSHVVVAEPPITARYTSAQQDNNPHQQLIGLSTSSACGDIREHKGSDDPYEPAVGLSTSSKPGGERHPCEEPIRLSTPSASGEIHEHKGNFTGSVDPHEPAIGHSTSSKPGDERHPRQDTIRLSTPYVSRDIREHEGSNSPYEPAVGLLTSSKPGGERPPRHETIRLSTLSASGEIHEHEDYDDPREPDRNTEHVSKHGALSFEQINNLEYMNENTLLNISNKNELAQTERSRHYSSRAQIEYEIFNMIKNILLFDQHQTCQSLYIADGRCHFDVLFDKLNCQNQTIWRYLEYNRKIYEKGIDMVYLIQGYFAPCHFLEENWKQQFSTYMEHQVVYGVVGMHPLYAHHLDLKMELNIRRCISHPKVKGVGEIGLDCLSISRPSDDIQIKAFRQQIQMALTNQLPILIYSKNSFLQILDILCNELPFDYPICWRNFNYNLEELNMLTSRFTCIYFSCSPLVFINKKMEKIMHHVDIKNIIPESVSPHLKIKECPNVWETHPIFVASVYKFIAVLHNLSIQAAAKQLVDNIEKFYKLI